MTEISDFHDVAFPSDIAFGAQRTVTRATEIVTLGSGREHRNQRWRHSRRRYDAGFGIKSLEDLRTVVAFYEARRGAQSGFRLKDPFDWRSRDGDGAIGLEDQPLGLGDGAKTEFSLVKAYGGGDDAYRRPIHLPVAGSVMVGIDGIGKTENSDFLVDYQTGTVTFSVPPQPGAMLTAGFEYDVPVRFADDELSVSLSAFNAGDIPSVPLLEVTL
ncbi:TIGR02217 family protein [Pseudahrensia aquimaris]|uniref:TIGR02217 family protein n=1 Tax=Pseudahrensia aquimaris TaxID=744461 RepID=A0ABW3FBM2_9HYPH